MPQRGGSHSLEDPSPAPHKCREHANIRSAHMHWQYGHNERSLMLWKLAHFDRSCARAHTHIHII
eukprot:1159402-Pelagomonas_calceolata.AAC.14